MSKLMEIGEPGRNGLAALRHVDLGQEPEQGTVTIHLQLMEAKTVQDHTRRLDFVTQMLVQVQSLMLLFKWICYEDTILSSWELGGLESMVELLPGMRFWHKK